MKLTDIPLDQVFQFSASSQAECEPRDVHLELRSYLTGRALREYKSGISRDEVDYLASSAVEAVTDKSTGMIPWNMENGQAEFVGRLPKRLASVLKKLKPDSVFVPENIGYYVQRCRGADDEDNMWFDFTNKVDWKAGRFGDSGSCWWSYYAHSKSTLMLNGGLAFRIYRYKGDLSSSYEGTSKYQFGVGRCWLIPFQHRYAKDRIWAFNFYGINKQFQIKLLPKAMRILTGQSWFSESYGVEINVTSRSGRQSGSGLMFINSGPVIVDKEVNRQLDHYVLRKRWYRHNLTEVDWRME